MNINKVDEFLENYQLLMMDLFTYFTKKFHDRGLIRL